MKFNSIIIIRDESQKTVVVITNQSAICQEKAITQCDNLNIYLYLQQYIQS